MNKRKVTVINNTKFKTSDIKEIAGALLEGQLAPNFYLICCPEDMDGLALTNLDMPTIVIRIKDLGQFAKVFVHELIHLQQHSQNYTNEKEAVREVVISDINNPNGITIIKSTEVSADSSHS